MFPRLVSSGDTDRLMTSEGMATFLGSIVGACVFKSVSMLFMAALASAAQSPVGTGLNSAAISHY
jgi:hypothetical protein